MHGIMNQKIQIFFNKPKNVIFYFFVIEILMNKINWEQNLKNKARVFIYIRMHRTEVVLLNFRMPVKRISYF